VRLCLGHGPDATALVVADRTDGADRPVYDVRHLAHFRSACGTPESSSTSRTS
jgi:hypothetical protein